MSEGPREQENNRSSLFEKLPPDLRRQLDLAIVHRVPPSFRAVWMQFELAKFGVSYSALYRYARRRSLPAVAGDRINTAEAVLLSGDDEPDVDAAIQKLLSRRLLELLLHTGGAECTTEIAALTSAHRKGALSAHDGRRLELDRDHLRLKAEALQITRRALPIPNPQSAILFILLILSIPASPASTKGSPSPTHPYPLSISSRTLW